MLDKLETILDSNQSKHNEHNVANGNVHISSVHVVVVLIKAIKNRRYLQAFLHNLPNNSQLYLLKMSENIVETSLKSC